MKTKIVMSAILMASFLLISTGFIYSDYSLSDDKKNNAECPYLQEKSEIICPYSEGKVNKSDSECPYLNGKTTCPYSRNESKPETSNKGKSKEIKFYRTIKNIST